MAEFVHGRTMGAHKRLLLLLLRFLCSRTEQANCKDFRGVQTYTVGIGYRRCDSPAARAGRAAAAGAAATAVVCKKTRRNNMGVACSHRIAGSSRKQRHFGEKTQGQKVVCPSDTLTGAAQLALNTSGTREPSSPCTQSFTRRAPLLTFLQRWSTAPQVLVSGNQENLNVQQRSIFLPSTASRCVDPHPRES